MLSKDILTVPEDEIPTAQVVYTIVGGKVVLQERGELRAVLEERAQGSAANGARSESRELGLHAK